MENQNEGLNKDEKEKNEGVKYGKKFKISERIELFKDEKGNINPSRICIYRVITPIEVKVDEKTGDKTEFENKDKEEVVDKEYVDYIPLYEAYKNDDKVLVALNTCKMDVYPREYLGMTNRNLSNDDLKVRVNKFKNCEKPASSLELRKRIVKGKEETGGDNDLFIAGVAPHSIAEKLGLMKTSTLNLVLGAGSNDDFHSVFTDKESEFFYRIMKDTKYESQYEDIMFKRVNNGYTLDIKPITQVLYTFFNKGAEVRDYSNQWTPEYKELMKVMGSLDNNMSKLYKNEHMDNLLKSMQNIVKEYAEKNGIEKTKLLKDSAYKIKYEYKTVDEKLVQQPVLNKDYQPIFHKETLDENDLTDLGKKIKEEYDTFCKEKDGYPDFYKLIETSDIRGQLYFKDEKFDGYRMAVLNKNNNLKIIEDDIKKIEKDIKITEENIKTRKEIEGNVDKEAADKLDKLREELKTKEKEREKTKLEIKENTNKIVGNVDEKVVRGGIDEDGEPDVSLFENAFGKLITDPELEVKSIDPQDRIFRAQLTVAYALELAVKNKKGADKEPFIERAIKVRNYLQNGVEYPEGMKQPCGKPTKVILEYILGEEQSKNQTTEHIDAINKLLNWVNEAEQNTQFHINEFDKQALNDHKILMTNSGLVMVRYDEILEYARQHCKIDPSRMDWNDLSANELNETITKTVENIDTQNLLQNPILNKFRSLSTEKIKELNGNTLNTLIQKNLFRFLEKDVIDVLKERLYHSNDRGFIDFIVDNIKVFSSDQIKNIKQEIIDKFSKNDFIKLANTSNFRKFSDNLVGIIDTKFGEQAKNFIIDNIEAFSEPQIKSIKSEIIDKFSKDDFTQLANTNTLKYFGNNIVDVINEKLNSESKKFIINNIDFFSSDQIKNIKPEMIKELTVDDIKKLSKLDRYKLSNFKEVISNNINNLNVESLHYAIESHFLKDSELKNLSDDNIKKLPGRACLILLKSGDEFHFEGDTLKYIANKINYIPDNDFVNFIKEDPNKNELLKAIFETIGYENLSLEKFGCLMENFGYDLLNHGCITIEQISKMNSEIFNKFVAPTIFKNADALKYFLPKLDMEKINGLPDELFKNMFDEKYDAVVLNCYYVGKEKIANLSAEKLNILEKDKFVEFIKYVSSLERGNEIGELHREWFPCLSTEKMELVSEEVVNKLFEDGIFEKMNDEQVERLPLEVLKNNLQHIPEKDYIRLTTSQLEGIVCTKEGGRKKIVRTEGSPDAAFVELVKRYFDSADKENNPRKNYRVKKFIYDNLEVIYKIDKDLCENIVKDKDIEIGSVDLDKIREIDPKLFEEVLNARGESLDIDTILDMDKFKSAEPEKNPFLIYICLFGSSIDFTDEKLKNRIWRESSGAWDIYTAYKELKEKKINNVNEDNKENSSVITQDQVLKHIKDKDKGKEDDLNSLFCSNNSNNKNSYGRYNKKNRKKLGKII